MTVCRIASTASGSTVIVVCVPLPSGTTTMVAYWWSAPHPAAYPTSAGMPTASPAGAETLPDGVSLRVLDPVPAPGQAGGLLESLLALIFGS